MNRLDHIGLGSKEKPARFDEAFYAETERQFDVFKRTHPITPKIGHELMLARLGLGPIPDGYAVEDSDGLHTHVCGYDERDHTLKGCGHVWRHEGHDACDQGAAHFREAHTCPNCGRGTWTFKLMPDDPRAIEIT